MLDTIKQKLRTILMALAALAVAYGAGWASKKPQEIIQVEEKIVEKVVEKIVEVERQRLEKKKITKVTTRADGSTTTTTIDSVTGETLSSSDHETSSESEQSKKTSSQKPAGGDGSYRPNYSAGVEAVTDFKSLDPTYRATIGYRILGNMWGTSGYHLENNELSLGLRIDF